MRPNLVLPDLDPRNGEAGAVLQGTDWVIYRYECDPRFFKKVYAATYEDKANFFPAVHKVVTRRETAKTERSTADLY